MDAIERSRSFKAPVSYTHLAESNKIQFFFKSNIIVLIRKALSWLNTIKAYLESKSKMCIFSQTNTNPNQVVPSLCLVFLNAHANAPNSSLNFLQIFTLVENVRICVCGEMTSYVELVAITDLLECCKADALGCNGYRSRNTGEFPTCDIMPLCKGKGRKWSYWIKINQIWLIVLGNTS